MTTTVTAVTHDKLLFRISWRKLTWKMWIYQMMTAIRIGPIKKMSQRWEVLAMTAMAVMTVMMVSAVVVALTGGPISVVHSFSVGRKNRGWKVAEPRCPFPSRGVRNMPRRCMLPVIRPFLCWKMRSGGPWRIGHGRKSRPILEFICCQERVREKVSDRKIMTLLMMALSSHSQPVTESPTQRHKKKRRGEKGSRMR